VAYELLSHPADVKFRADGASLEAAFRVALGAVAAIVTDGQPVPAGAGQTRSVAIEARIPETLLLDFLDRVILFQDVENAVVTGVRECSIVEVETGFEWTATLVGVAIGPQGMTMDPKAPTYSELAVSETGDGWTLDAVIAV
jgi:SHS2 domain-containing protein